MVTRNQLAKLILFFQLLSIHSFSQVSDSLFELSCQHEDLVILNEEMEVNFTGQKLPQMYLTVSNKMTVIIKTYDGLSGFYPFTLPKKIDELYIFHAPTIRNIKWEYDAIENQSFSARFSNHNEPGEKIQVNKVVNTKRILDNAGFFGTIYTYDYFFENIKLGDTIEVSYSYKIPFRENWIRLLSNRIFFHGNYPKKSYHLKWSYNKNMVVDSLFIRHDMPEVTIVGNKIIYNWHFQNLPGCLNEPGSRPHKTLPYFLFVPKPYDFEYTHFDSFKQEFIPIYYFEAIKLQSQLVTGHLDNVIGNKNKNNLHYQIVADKIVRLAPDDTLGMEKMCYFQQYMVDSVTYSPSVPYYNHEEDQLKQRPGVDLLAYRVEDNNLEIIYGNMVPKLGLDLFTAYPVDKRTGEISPMYNPTVKENDKLFAIQLSDETIGLVIPKSDKNHYYFEELPFYYENIPVLLMHIYDYSNPLTSIFYFDFTNYIPSAYSSGYGFFAHTGGKRNFYNGFRAFTTPASDYKDNYRKIQSKVSITIEDNIANFKTRIILSGQYSTLTRCVYCQKPIDSTINPIYLEPIWNIADNVEVKNVNPQHPLIYFPFKTTIIAEYEASGILQSENKQIHLKPGSWFKLVYKPDCENKIRFLDYYPDFIGSDSYSYLLEFDKPIKLISSLEIKDITNRYGHFCFLTKQIDENKILLTCNYNITTDRIEKDSFNLVKSINQSIATLAQEEIIFEVVE